MDRELRARREASAGRPRRRENGRCRGLQGDRGGGALPLEPGGRGARGARGRARRQGRRGPTRRRVHRNVVRPGGARRPLRGRARRARALLRRAPDRGRDRLRPGHRQDALLQAGLRFAALVDETFKRTTWWNPPGHPAIDTPGAALPPHGRRPLALARRLPARPARLEGGARALGAGRPGRAPGPRAARRGGGGALRALPLPRHARGVRGHGRVRDDGAAPARLARDPREADVRHGRSGRRRRPLRAGVRAPERRSVVRDVERSPSGALVPAHAPAHAPGGLRRHRGAGPP